MAAAIATCFSDKLHASKHRRFYANSLTQYTDFLRKKESFYSEDELYLLHQLENDLVKSKSHDDVMENLRQVLKLDEV